jgi:hypothetical protein
VSGRVAALGLASAAVFAVAACGGATHTATAAGGAARPDRCALGTVTAPAALPSPAALALDRLLRDTIVPRFSCTAARLLAARTVSYRVVMARIVPAVVGRRLDRAEALLAADHVPLLGVGYSARSLVHGSGPARDWTVCSSQPAPGKPLLPPASGVWLEVRHSCA